MGEYHLIQTLTTVIKKSQINLELLHKYTRTPLHLGKILERKKFNYDSGIDFQFRFKS